jgi:hypothetical protein
MKKREFLAMTGAVPLMVAGCGGSGSGTAQMRLVNASVGYPNLGLLVNTTQATSTDVAYGSASPFAGVPAGSVTTTLTTTNNGVVTNLPFTSRTLSKDARYSMVAYGFSNAPKSVLILENQAAPNSGYASINVLNTSTDIGAVDVYVTTGASISGLAPLAPNVTGVSQSVFVQITAGTYTITVTGAGKPADVRQTIANVQLSDQQIATLILTPGQSGVLANSILLTQGTTGTVTNYPNGFARIRAIAATGNTGLVSVLVGAQIVASSLPSPNFSKYVLVPAPANTVPVVKTDTVPSVPVVVGGGQTITTTNLVAGADYTLLVYGAPANPQAYLFFDDNRLPNSPTNCKVRLLNGLIASPPLLLTLNINSSADNVVSDVPAGEVSPYDEVAAPLSVQSSVTVTSGFQSIGNAINTVLQAGNMYTMLVAGDTSGTVVNQFLQARL